MPMSEALPAQNSTAWYPHYSELDREVRARAGALWQIDNFAGADDDAKFGAALSAAAASTRKPVLQFPARYFGPLTTTRTPFTGMKIIGPDGGDGVKNLEISGGNLVSHAVRVQCGTGASSLFVQSASIQEVILANVAFSGSTGSQFWHNTNPAAVTVYPALLHSLSFDGFNSVLGSPAAKFTCTQTVFSGHWTVLNYQTTPLHIGGSDNTLWWDGYLNSNSPASVAGAGNPILWLDWLEKSVVGFVFITAENDWSGLRVDGPILRHITLVGGVYEGRSTANPATRPVIDIRGGHVHMIGTDLGHVVGGANAAGAIIQSGGLLRLDGAHYRLADTTAATFPLLYQTGGIAHVSRPIQGSGGSCYIRQSSGTTTEVPYPTANTITTW